MHDPYTVDKTSRIGFVLETIENIPLRNWRQSTWPQQIIDNNIKFNNEKQRKSKNIDKILDIDTTCWWLKYWNNNGLIMIRTSRDTGLYKISHEKLVTHLRPRLNQNKCILLF